MATSRKKETLVETPQPSAPAPQQEPTAPADRPTTSEAPTPEAPAPQEPTPQERAAARIRKRAEVSEAEAEENQKLVTPYDGQSRGDSIAD